MKIALVTTVWNRMDITLPVLEHYASLDPDGVTLKRMAVCSSHKEGERIQKIPGWDVTYYLNDPLSEKHNQGVKYARSIHPDAVCIVNSDDLLTGEYFGAATHMIADKGRDVVRFLSSVMIDTVNGRGAYVPNSFPASGIVLTKEVCETLDWRPWSGTPINKFLDQRLGDNLYETDAEAAGFRPLPDSTIQLCSLKSEHQIWSYDEHINVCDGEPGELDPEPYLEQHFPSVLDLVGNHVPD